MEWQYLKRPSALGFAAWVIAALLASRSAATVILTDSPDIKIRDATIDSIEARGYETSVAVHPNDWRIVLMGLITLPSTKSGGWFSTDGGLHWHGDNQPADSRFSGDPSVAILKGSQGSPTRYLIQSITAEAGAQEQWVTWADTPSAPWTGDARICAPDETTDKGFLCADNRPSSLYFGQLYSLWSPPNAGLYFRYSLPEDRGQFWRPLDNPIPLRASGSTWGGVISVGIAPDPKLGDVYVAWPNATSINAAPSSIVFKRSDDGGQGFPLSATTITSSGYSGRSLGPNSPLGQNTGENANSIPTMAADDLGNIYVAWCQLRRSGDGAAGDDAQLYVSTSSCDGDSFGTPAPITTSTANQWLPWIAWDDEAKALAAVYYDDRNDPDSAEVYLAVSYDHGSNFTEFKISGAPGSGDVFVGDYIGIACGGGIAYPVWCDDRESVRKAFTSPILIGGIDDATITATVGHHCEGVYDPRVRFEVDWSTLATMDGPDTLTVTPPGQNPVTVTASSTSKTHELVAYNVPCVPGVWTYVVESNKGALESRSSTLSKSVACISCPPPCRPPCEFE